jgi:hypothetical protein
MQVPLLVRALGFPTHLATATSHFVRDAADDERACDRAGQRRRREGEAASVVDPTLTGVGGRAGGGVEEDRGQADRRQRRRPFVRIEQEQDRGEDEAAARADDRAERSDSEAEQREQDGGCWREAQCRSRSGAKPDDTRRLMTMRLRTRWREPFARPAPADVSVALPTEGDTRLESATPRAERATVWSAETQD